MKAEPRKPGVRVDGAKRTDLTEQRRRHELQQQSAKPVEDTRVADAWARDDARMRSAKLDAAEAVAIKRLPPKMDIVRDRRDNPDFSRDHAVDKLANFKKADMDVNANESAITILAAKKVLDDAQVKAADRFRSLFEACGGKGARAMDYTREFVDGGRFPDPIGNHQIDAGKKLAEAYEVLTKKHGLYGWKIVGYICGEGRSIHEMTSTRRQRDTLTDQLRMYLDCLAEHWLLSTANKGTAPKRALQGLTSRA